MAQRRFFFRFFQAVLYEVAVRREAAPQPVVALPSMQVDWKAKGSEQGSGNRAQNG
jgi:hypothetical protein